jgi:exportin-5
MSGSAMDAGTAPHMALPNGGCDAPNGSTQNDVSQVREALQAIFDPRVSNDTRRQATEYLDRAKRHPDAPSQGCALATDRSQGAEVRHFGLSMLEYSIKYNWEDFTEEQGLGLRGYVIELARHVAEDDPSYLGNKVAQLWTEIAKRTWGAEWMDMDEQLLSLWTNSLHHQAVVLCVLETLSEDVFNREDATAGLRGSDLGRACVEIFTPVAVLQEQLPTRDKSLAVRCGDEGWMKRLCDNLGWCLTQDLQNQKVRDAAVKTMNALRAAMPWIIPKAIAATQVIEAVCKALATPRAELQLVCACRKRKEHALTNLQAAVEVLQAIYSRHHLHEDEFVELVCPMFTPGSVSLLREVYSWSITNLDVNEIDQERYTLCKKLSEVSSHTVSLVPAPDVLLIKLVGE